MFIEVVRKWTCQHKDSTEETVLMSKELYRMTLEAIGAAAFGEDFVEVDIEVSINHVIKKVKLQEALCDNFQKGFLVARSYLFGNMLPDFLRKNLTKNSREYFSNMDKIRTKIIEIVDKKDVEWVRMGKPDNNLLDMLLKKKEMGLLNKEDVISEAIQFIFAGHETSARAITSLLYHLCKNPAVLKKIKQEIKTVIFQGKDNIAEIDELITQEKLMELNYTLLSIKEALRIDPPANAIPYIAKSKFTLPNGVTVHEGTWCTPNVVLVHNNPLIWKSPREFIPERFDPQSDFFLTPSGEKRHPLSFMPFVAGPRNCIGQNFAMLEIKHIVVYLLSNFKFELAKDEDGLLFGIPLSTPLELKLTKLNSIN